MNVLVVGKGYVGSAVCAAFKRDKVTVVDPRFSRITIEQIKHETFDIVFVCVDTPKNEHFQTLQNVLQDIEKYLPNSLVCCKSTASPEFYEKMQRQLHLRLVFSPEYLSHWNHIQDFKNQTFVIVGGKSKIANKVAKILVSRLTKVKRIGITDIATAALVKYAENAFLASKVTFANELHAIHKAMPCKSSYEQFIHMLTMDARMGNTHWQVPGRDGKHGWGGHCYTKDNAEFAKFSKSPWMKFVRKLNNRHRKN